MADAFLQEATQAPHPMQAAASMAWSESSLGMGTAFPSGALAGANRNKTTGLNNLIKRGAVYDQITDNRKSPSPERLDSQSRLVLELPHVKLASSG